MLAVPKITLCPLRTILGTMLYPIICDAITWTQNSVAARMTRKQIYFFSSSFFYVTHVICVYQNCLFANKQYLAQFLDSEDEN